MIKPLKTRVTRAVADHMQVAPHQPRHQPPTCSLPTPTAALGRYIVNICRSLGSSRTTSLGPRIVIRQGAGLGVLAYLPASPTYRHCSYIHSTNISLPFLLFPLLGSVQPYRTIALSRIVPPPLLVALLADRITRQQTTLSLPCSALLCPPARFSPSRCYTSCTAWDIGATCIAS